MTNGQSETSPAASPLPSSAAEPGEAPDHARKSSLAVLALGALGIVYGDIGTSPLYTVHEVFAGSGHIPLTPGLRSYRSRVGFWLWAAIVFELFALIGVWPSAPAVPRRDGERIRRCRRVSSCFTGRG